MFFYFLFKTGIDLWIYCIQKLKNKLKRYGVNNMTHHNEEKKDHKKDDGEAKVEPIHPSEQRGGKKKGLLDTCK
jgi:hypothetical protein